MPAPTPFDVIYSPFSAGVLPAFVVDPDEGELISVSFNPTYLPYVVGAAKSLVQPALYRGVADIELQLNRANLLLSMINNPNVYERPFYDDDEQMDDSTLPVAPWYEEVSDWIITLFLAVTFTPGAAIVYKTTIPRLRLAFRTGNIGTMVRVLIDDIEVWTGNTYSASEGMLETVIDVPATPGIMRSLLPNEHILKVVHAGVTGQKLEVVRGDIRPQMTTLLRMDQQCGTLQVSYDGGVYWENVVDIGSCITAGVSAGIQDALDDGTLAAPAQQPAGGQIPAQECRTYKITLHGNSRWNCPIPVRAGYTITTANARGATGDNATITAIWGCPDGKNYFLGACGAANATQGTDPLQSQPHLRLIGYCSGVYMDMYNTTYAVPQGTPDSAFFLQVNDGDISDNQGELQLDVTVCNHETVVEYSFLNSVANGFTDGGCGAFGEPSANGYRATWYSGGPLFWNFRMFKQAVRATYLRTIEIEYTLGVVGNRFYYSENCGLTTAITMQTGAPTIQTVNINRNISQNMWIGLDHQGQIGNNTENARMYIRRLKYTFSGLSAWND